MVKTGTKTQLGLHNNWASFDEADDHQGLDLVHICGGHTRRGPPTIFRPIGPLRAYDGGAKRAGQAVRCPANGGDGRERRGRRRRGGGRRSRVPVGCRLPALLPRQVTASFLATCSSVPLIGRRRRSLLVAWDFPRPVPLVRAVSVLLTVRADAWTWSFWQKAGRNLWWPHMKGSCRFRVFGCRLSAYLLCFLFCSIDWWLVLSRSCDFLLNICLYLYWFGVQLSQLWISYATVGSKSTGSYVRECCLERTWGFFWLHYMFALSPVHATGEICEM